jgi:hypothetical protein
VKKNDIRILRKRKRKLARRLERKQWSEQREPMLRARNIQYEMAERTRGIDCGGMGAFHVLAGRTGLIEAIDRGVKLLKRHLPYHESDHILNIAYNILTGGRCLDDIELRRNDESYMDALGAERIPDPTTEGDFTRRFSESEVVELMEVVNRIREKMWNRCLSGKERKLGIIDVDGIVAATSGECKEGMDMAYNGEWGYHPLLVSLANTMEPLYLMNRPGNRPSHEGAVEWMDRAAVQVGRVFARVCFRGDTDFSLTGELDRWTEEGKEFVFGMDARPNLVGIAEGLGEDAWRVLERGAKESKGASRARRERVKERIVEERGYKNKVLDSEQVAEFGYRPVKCKRTYRMVVLRKTVQIKEGQKRLFDEKEYFFYITNKEDLSTGEAVLFANERCDQENLGEQLKNGLHALRMPVGDLVSNWAYMVMASLAWTLKAWFALLVRRGERRRELLGMEFRRFLNAVVRLPGQIIRTGRRIVYRLLGYNEWIWTFLRTFDVIRGLTFI